jgi:hypothetical protein
MKELSRDAYFTEAYTSYQRYTLHNTWFKWGPTVESIVTRHLLAGWNAYKKVQSNTLKSLLLGDTKMRSDADLLANFGLSSSFGPDESRLVEKFIKDVTNKKDALPAGADLFQNKPAAPSEASSAGSGWVLSTSAWSPMLNDTFIMAAVHKGFDFHLALTDEDAAAYAALTPTPKGEAELWRTFFVKCPQMLYRDGVPRVFARELICLKTFGYTPQFFKTQLSFGLNDQKAGDGASLEAALSALEATHFHKGDKDKIVATVASYLFGAPDALKG